MAGKELRITTQLIIQNLKKRISKWLNSWDEIGLNN